MGMPPQNPQRPAMRLLLITALGFVLIASIFIFWVISRRSSERDVVVTAPTSTPLPAPVIVASPASPTAVVLIATLPPTTTPVVATPAPIVVTLTPGPAVAAAPPGAAPTSPAAAPAAPAPPPAVPPPPTTQPAAAPPAPAAAAPAAPAAPEATKPSGPPPAPTAAPPPPVAAAPKAPAVAPTSTPAAPPPKPGAVDKTGGQTGPDQDTVVRCPDNRVQVTIRANSLPRGVTVTCRTADPGAVPPPPGRRIGDILFALESTAGDELPGEVNLGITYRPEDLQGASEQQLVIATFEDGQWRPAPKLVTDPPNNHVSATITEMGVYTVYARQ